VLPTGAYGPLGAGNPPNAGVVGAPVQSQSRLLATVSSATIALPDNFKGWALGAYHRLRRKQIQSSISTSSYFASTAAATDMPPSALCSASPP
jgi:hypothetical protein